MKRKKEEGLSGQIRERKNKKRKMKKRWKEFTKYGSNLLLREGGKL